MNHPILTTRITAQGLVPLRTRARQVGELFGLDKMQRTRFITALSEIARNAVQYAGGGTVTFLLDAGTERADRCNGCWDRSRTRARASPTWRACSRAA